MSQIDKTCRPSGLIYLRWVFSDKRAPGRLDYNRSCSCQRIVGMPDSIKIDPEAYRDLPHCRHFFTRFKDASADSPEQLISDLDIDRNTGPLYVESI